VTLAQIYRHRWNGRELAELRAIWKVLVREYFQAFIPANGRVLDIGCGFCHFLNEAQAAERIGVDANPEAKRFADPGVEVLTVDDLELRELKNDHFDFIFISNFLEHLDGCSQVLGVLRRAGELLSPNGRLVVLQPNFRLLGWRYFDFIDHKTILTDAGMREAVDLSGLTLERQILRFLPYTSKSRFPRHPALVSLYLRFPLLWKIFGKQSLFIARRTTIEEPLGNLDARQR
jgi:SAM-dependent methyltransferase